MAKIWLVIHHPFRRGAFGARIAQETRDRTFLTSVDVIRYARLLETQQKTMKWGWLFKSYFQWHALAFLLAELCVRTSGPAVEDAWAVVEEAWPDWDKASSSKGLVLWKPIVRLFNRAKAIRQKEFQKRKTFPMDGTLGPILETSNPRNSVQAPNNDNLSTQPNYPGTLDFVPRSNGQFTANNSNLTYQNSSGDAMDFTPNPQYMQPASPSTDLNQFTHSLIGVNGILDDPVMQNDPLLDLNINWEDWDAGLVMDFQNEMTQPIKLNVDQLWDAP
jgi:hypothetical protein